MPLSKPIRTPRKPRKSAASAQSLIRYAGGKTKVRGIICDRIQAVTGAYPHGRSRIASYCEPFVGTGAIYFELCARGELGDRHSAVILNDINPAMTLLLEWMRDDPFGYEAKAREIVATLKGADGHTRFHAVRDLWNREDWTGCAQKVAALWLRLASFNGLWRENKAGGFNVPMRKGGMGVDFDSQQLQQMARWLDHAKIYNEDWRVAVDASALQQEAAGARRSVYYIDPPYAGQFSSYSKHGFGTPEQIELLQVAAQLDKQGHSVFLSNCSLPAYKALVAEHWPEAEVYEYECARRISCKASTRGNTTELLVHSKPR